MFITQNNDTDNRKTCDLYLPSISPIYTESTLHVLVVRKEHIHFEEISADYDDFVKLKTCYTKADKLSKKGYVEDLAKFACKALKIKETKNLEVEIAQIED